MERLFVQQKAKLIELTNEYLVRDEHGNEVGAMRQEGQSTAKKLLRLVSNVDQFLTHTYALYDSTGQKVLEMKRPAKVFKSTFEVSSGPDALVGRIKQENVVGKKRFGFEDAAGTPLGALKAENWRSWDFQLVDVAGTPIGRITKQWAGIGRELFTTADNYLVEIAPSVQGPLRYLCLAAGVGVDTALKQDDN